MRQTLPFYSSYFLPSYSLALAGTRCRFLNKTFRKKKSYIQQKPLRDVLIGTPETVVCKLIVQMGLEVETLAQLVEGSPFAMPALSLLVLCGAVCPVPGLFSSGLVAAGFTLGFWRGLCAVYPAAVLGAVISFAAGRRLGERWRAYIPAKVASLCDVIGDGGFFMLLLLRLTPLTVCASSAFLGCESSPRTRGGPELSLALASCCVRTVPTISARTHAAASAVGFLRLAMHVHIGTTLRLVANSGGSETERWASVGGAVVAALAVGNGARLVLQSQRQSSTDPKKHE